MADTFGGLQTLAVFTLPVLALALAAGVEFVDISRMRSNLQGIADSTALNGARQYSVDPSANTLNRLQAWAESQTEAIRGKWSVTTTVTADKAVNTVTVAIAGQRSSFVGSLLPTGNAMVDVTSTGVNAATYPLCVLGTQQASATIVLQGTPKVTAQDCLVQSNGDLLAQGGSSVRAGAIRAGGRASGDLAPAPTMDAPVIRDPFASLPILVPATCTDVIVQVGSGTTTLNPGVHCGSVQLLGAATIVLNPGEHYFVGPVFSLGSNVTLRGSDVVVIFKNQPAASIAGNVTLSIEGRKSGPFAGFALIGDRSFTGTLTISSTNAKKLLGTIYLPSGTLHVAGVSNRIADQSPWTIVVAKAITASGSPELVINSAYASVDTPVPQGVGPGAVRLKQ